MKKLRNFFKCRDIVRETCDDGLLNVLSEVFKIKFNLDQKTGRVYGVLNLLSEEVLTEVTFNINSEENFDKYIQTGQAVKDYVYNRLNIINNMFIEYGVLDAMYLDIEYIGGEIEGDEGCFAIIFYPNNFNNYIKYRKTLINIMLWSIPIALLGIGYILYHFI